MMKQLDFEEWVGNGQQVQGRDCGTGKASCPVWLWSYEKLGVTGQKKGGFYVVLSWNLFSRQQGRKALMFLIIVKWDIISVLEAGEVKSSGIYRLILLGQERSIKEASDSYLK